MYNDFLCKNLFMSGYKYCIKFVQGSKFQIKTNKCLGMFMNKTKTSTILHFMAQIISLKIFILF